MACLREQAAEGRFRTLQCNETDCEFRLNTDRGRRRASESPSEGDCLLQLRLRAGDAEESGDISFDKAIWGLLESPDTRPIRVRRLGVAAESGGESGELSGPLDGGRRDGGDSVPVQSDDRAVYSLVVYDPERDAFLI